MFLLLAMLGGVSHAQIARVFGVTLAGALAAGLSERLYEDVVLKTYGASKRQLMGAFALEYAGLGLAAAVFGLLP